MVATVTCNYDPEHPGAQCGIYSAVMDDDDPNGCDYDELPVNCQKTLQAGWYDFYLDACPGTIGGLAIFPGACEEGQYAPDCP